jgi:protein-tyrosine phosphatase
MVDIHCHILPQVDDGAKSWEIATEMCRMAVADGITHVIATPHANEEYAYNREEHAARLQELQNAVGERPLLGLGCDFHFSFDNVQDALKSPGRYSIAGTQYLLVEFSDFGVSRYLNDAIYHVRSQGIIPIVTHPERNRLLQHHPQNVLAFVEQGCIVQVTASSYTGRWGSGARKAAEWLLEHDAVHVLATDAHDTEHRPPVLSAGRDAVAKIVGLDVARALVEDNPAAIVAGEALPYLPTPVSR